LEKSKGLDDSTRIAGMFVKHFSEIFENTKEEDRDALFDKIAFRMQRLCNEFKQISIRADRPSKGDWEILKQKPTSTLSPTECNSFKLIHEFYYFESATGDTVRLSIKGGFWIDQFTDNTFSKLRFYWINDCEFEIEFIESNNRSRKNFSMPGDKYKYQIIGKGTGFFKLSVEVVGSSQFYSFKLYY
jgi:hypothetical protein